VLWWQRAGDFGLCCGEAVVGNLKNCFGHSWGET
jgi:hypothetical protein